MVARGGGRKLERQVKCALLASRSTPASNRSDRRVQSNPSTDRFGSERMKTVQEKPRSGVGQPAVCVRRR